MEDKDVKLILERFRSFKKNKYSREEHIEEVLKLQDEIVEFAFERVNTSIYKQKVLDVVDYYSDIIERHKLNLDSELNKFKKLSEEFTGEIARQISGLNGEERTFAELNLLNSKNIIMKNVVLGDKKLSTEIDALVITPKCITIVETKNVSGDIRIDTNGKLSHNNEDLGNLSGKIKDKKRFIRGILKELNLDISKLQSIVVFTNDDSEIKFNKSKIKICRLEELNHIIDGFAGADVFSEDQMKNIEKTINKNRYKGEYICKFSFKTYKYVFADLKYKVDRCIRREETEQEKMCESYISQYNVLNNNENNSSSKTVDNIKKGDYKDENRILVDNIKKRILRLHIVINNVRETNY